MCRESGGGFVFVDVLATYSTARIRPAAAVDDEQISGRSAPNGTNRSSYNELFHEELQAGDGADFTGL